MDYDREEEDEEKAAMRYNHKHGGQVTLQNKILDKLRCDKKG